jgi:hypothetical protein
VTPASRWRESQPPVRAEVLFIYRIEPDDTSESVRTEHTSHWKMAVTRLLSLLLTIVLFSACNRAPSRAESFALLRGADPALDTAAVVERVWADGPPWFSCAEVIAKLRANADSAVVRNQIGNWRPLVLADWVILRDTAAGRVIEPGWCHATLRDAAARLAGGWREVRGDLLPSGDRRRGWDVPAGRQRLAVRDAPRAVGEDSVAVDFLLTVTPNANGVALGADRDSTRRRALLWREDGRWRAVRLNWPSTHSVIPD